MLDNAADRSELHGYIEAHYRHTGSRIAAGMLRDRASYVAQFIKVMPIEYKKILAAEASRADAQ